MLGHMVCEKQGYFNDHLIPQATVVAQSLAILDLLPNPKVVQHTRNNLTPQIDRTKLWNFFDGAAQGDLKSCSGDAVIHIDENHYFHLKLELGEGANNYAKLMALKLLLTFSHELNIHAL